MSRKPRQDGKTPLPTKQELLDYIRESPIPLGKRELARAFQVKGDDRQALKALLAELKREGALDGHRGRKVGAADRLPEVTVLEIAGYDEDGELLARPPGADLDDPQTPVVAMAPDRRGARMVAGDRVLTRLRHIEGQRYEGFPIRHLGRQVRRVVGVYEKARRGGIVRPTNRQMKDAYEVPGDDAGGAQDGELVLLEPKGHHRRGGGKREGRVIERLGDATNPRALSLISIAEHGLPDVFPPDALKLAEKAGAVPLDKRLDLRRVPLVTIDGEDARDFDDAVFAEPDPEKGNAGGFRILVAIADVAHYVRPDDALDKEARKRGNSAYFPDRVIPMLPEALSNGWCSLRPQEERGCLVAEMRIDRNGRMLGHRFHRALMRSAARLTYEQVQEAADGKPDGTTKPLMKEVIEPLYAAYAALEKARQKRGTLDLDLPEKRVHLDEDGSVRAILPRPRLDSHRLIELFMIQANVAAAEALEGKRSVCMYRVHEPPDPQKVEALRQVLESYDLGFPKGERIRPELFTRVLEKVAGTEASPMVSELVLRAQSQARYSPENLGHFGLALQRYAHFTSPIRRYSDLLVHRALIAALRLGAGGLSKGDAELFEEWADHISATERRAAAAERDTVDRFVSLFLSGEVGSLKSGRVTSVTRFGLFVRLDETGADGLVPISSLPGDYYDHDERQHALIGRRHGRRYSLGERWEVRVCDADALSGSLTLELIEGEDAPTALPTRPGGKGRTARKTAERKAGGKKAKPKTARGRKKAGKRKPLRKG